MYHPLKEGTTMHTVKMLSIGFAVSSIGLAIYNFVNTEYQKVAFNGVFLAISLLALLFSLWRIERSRRGIASYELKNANKHLDASRSLAVIRDYDPPLGPYLFVEPEYAWVGTREKFLRRWPKEHPFQPGTSEDDRAISYRFVGFEPVSNGGVLMYETSAPGHFWDMSWDHYESSAKDRKLKPIKQ